MEERKTVKKKEPKILNTAILVGLTVFLFFTLIGLWLVNIQHNILHVQEMSAIIIEEVSNNGAPGVDGGIYWLGPPCIGAIIGALSGWATNRILKTPKSQ
ncbi:MAG: hypothetical protein PHH26_02775 [Candidatus Thermoplasmatota archaeon]|nr:hypothetical protein [Candidatus Thermoplasmatota archaeon]